MWWQAKQPEGRWTARRGLATIVLGAILLVVGLTANAANACLESEQASCAADVRIERVFVAPAATISASADRIAAQYDCNGLCCDAGFQSHGIACAGGLCTAGLATINSAASRLFAPIRSNYLSPFDQAETMSADPAPNLRPPRNFI